MKLKKQYSNIFVQNQIVLAIDSKQKFNYFVLTE